MGSEVRNFFKFGQELLPIRLQNKNVPFQRLQIQCRRTVVFNYTFCILTSMKLYVKIFKRGCFLWWTSKK